MSHKNSNAGYMHIYQHFTQDCYGSKGICVIASYAIIISAYSNQTPGDNKVNSVIEEYAKLYGVVGSNTAELGDNIHKHYHDYCKNNGNIRGFDYIKNKIHCEMGYDAYCRIIDSYANDIIPITPDKRKCLFDSLKEKENGNNRLAMIIFPTPKKMHAVVLFFNSDKGCIEVKDPNCYSYYDTVSKINDNNNEYMYNEEKDIYEYLLFERV
jgi:hypothetical protein